MLIEQRKSKWHEKFKQWQVIKWQTLKDILMKWWNNETANYEMKNWWNGKLMKWQIVEMTHSWNRKLMKCQVD